MAGFGQTDDLVENCWHCFRPKTGSMKGMVGGVGFGNERKPGIIKVCINQDCQEGRKNLAELAAEGRKS
jgi:hypothetical protein